MHSEFDQRPQDYGQQPEGWQIPPAVSIQSSLHETGPQSRHIDTSQIDMDPDRGAEQDVTTASVPNIASGIDVPPSASLGSEDRGAGGKPDDEKVGPRSRAPESVAALAQPALHEVTKPDEEQRSGGAAGAEPTAIPDAATHDPETEPDAPIVEIIEPTTRPVTEKPPDMTPIETTPPRPDAPKTSWDTVVEPTVTQTTSDTGPDPRTETTDTPESVEALDVQDAPRLELTPQQREVAGLHGALHDRLLSANFIDDAHYAAVGTEHGFASLSDRSRYHQIDAEVDVRIAGGDDKATRDWAQDLLTNRSSIIDIAVTETSRDPRETDVTREDRHYLALRPCDITPDEEQLGRYVWDVLGQHAPELTPDSDTPVVIAAYLDNPSDPRSLVTDLTNDRILAELYTTLTGNQIVREEGRSAADPAPIRPHLPLQI